MLDINKVKEMVNDPRRIGVIATADREGNPNAAVFGSVHMPDDLTIVMGLGDTRTAQNLLETEKAVFMSILANENPMLTQGCRVYLRLRSMENEGPNLIAIKARVAAKANEKAAAMIQYAVHFDIESTRPLIDWSPKQ